MKGKGLHEKYTKDGLQPTAAGYDDMEQMDVKAIDYDIKEK
jgi:hypothetical protein